MKLTVRICVAVAIFLSGCAQLANFQKLLVIKRYSDNQDLQEATVETQNRKFELLLKAVQRNETENYPDQESFIENFGDPIYSKQVIIDTKVFQRWLYRYPVRYFDSDKVYVYFDKKGRFVRWECVESRRKEQSNGRDKN